MQRVGQTDTNAICEGIVKQKKMFYTIHNSQLPNVLLIVNLFFINVIGEELS